MFTTENTSLKSGTLLYMKQGAKSSCQIITEGEEINLDPCFSNKFQQTDKTSTVYSKGIKMSCCCNSCDEDVQYKIVIGDQTIEADSEGNIDITEVLDACLNQGLLAEITKKETE